MTALSDLVKAQSVDDAKAALLAGLASGEFPTTSWQPGSVPRTLVDVHSEVLADLSSLVSAVAAGGQLDLATGDWLTLLAAGRYEVFRKAATFAEFNSLQLADSGSGPHEIEPGQLWFGTVGGLRYSNKTGGTLPKGGTLVLSVKAESAGAQYNVGTGAIRFMLTQLAGVTCSNLSPPSVQGADAESDAALRQRCKDKWATIGFGATEAAYRLWALSSDASITRAEIARSASAPGTVRVLIAGPSGAVTEPVRAACEAYIAERKPFVDGLEVAAAVNRSVSIAGVVYAANTAIAQAGAEANLLALQSSLPIAGTVYLAEIIERIMSAEGVVNVKLSSPTADTVLGASEVAVLAQSLSYLRA